MKRRKRINARAICSSYNYVASKKAHRLMLEINHLKNEEFFIEVQQRVTENKTVSYTKVKIFGKWVDLDGRDYNSFQGFEFK